jgi:hypothetical protein
VKLRPLQIRQFVSAGLADHVLADFAHVQAPNRLHCDEVLASPPAVGTNSLFRVFLPGDTPEIASRTERNAGADRGTTLGLRFD